ncbi:DUF3019 domain-containing protein [Thalassotalea fonticola]|uniref:DUF3019 domain-containing protein n=1 Tax=Thalassotalea fonticola TaxID=3065649 RepID=A0ABZ0GT81_9GAMM|nr:DUF3019 domain-containing protein [Colwelliaceae bacterium S1-1]
MRSTVFIIFCSLLVTLTDKAFAAPKNLLIGIPKQCVVNKKTDSCKTALTLSWELDNPQDICILKGAQIIHCEKNSISNSHTFDIDSQKPVIFKLVSMSSLVELSNFKFNILYLGKNSIKRRKLPWRIL